MPPNVGPGLRRNNMQQQTGKQRTHPCTNPPAARPTRARELSRARCRMPAHASHERRRCHAP
eukprot:15471426-Alexandrium_andersonii.AAC.1